MHMVNHMIKLIAILLLSLLSAQGFAENKTYKDSVSGKSCKESAGQQIDCQYKIGKDLHIYLAGIGLPDTSISFYSSNHESDYFARVGILHGCVIIVPGKSSNRGLLGNHAFISPKNGKVYETWPSCKAGR